MDEVERQIGQQVTQNIETIVSIHERAEREVGGHQRMVERVTHALGRPRTVYLIVAGVIVWALFNVLAARPIDPAPFFWMQGVVALASLLMTTMVLTTQNRHQREALRREHLDLQVNLLSEQKVAKVIQLLEELRRDLPVPDREDDVAKAMCESVDAQAVVSVVEQELESHK